MATDTKTKDTGELKKLLTEDTYLKIPKVGDIVKGKVINTAKNEVRIDIEGLTTGVIRGRELYRESPDYANLKPGDEVEATVLELENENGEMELSFRYAGHRKVWDNLIALKNEEKIIPVKIIEANKGGLMVQANRINGFLPVSQLIPEHYPRVQGGDKNKILEKLRQFIGQNFNVKVIDVSEDEEKLIVSEKAAWEETQKAVISKYKAGDIIEGKITAVTDFGAFVEFDENMEGLIHISELAWQRIDDPREYIKVGDKIKAAIINIDGSKIFLSVKKLMEDPWKKINEKYKIGDIVKGKVLKINPFGLFVELDRDIHGLAHVSELSDKPTANIREIAKIGDILEFRIVSVEPENHRLGLSIRALKENEASKEKDKPKEKENKSKKSVSLLSESETQKKDESAPLAEKNESEAEAKKEKDE